VCRSTKRATNIILLIKVKKKKQKKMSRKAYEKELPARQELGDYRPPDFSAYNFIPAVYP